MADLPWLEIQVPQQKPVVEEHGGRHLLFPAVLAPNPEAKLDLAGFTRALRGGASRAKIDELFGLTGAVLLRGFPVGTASEFDAVVEAFGYEEYPYVGGIASRTRVVGRVFTANEAPPEKRILFHHEMSHVPDFPTKIFFFCEVEPGSGGETPIVPSHLIYERMAAKHPDFVRGIEEHGWSSTRYIGEEDDHSSPIGRSWQSTFSTTDKSIAEERAAKLGAKLEWIEGGAKMIVGPIPGIRVDEARGGRKVWFNSIALGYAWKKDGVVSANDVTFGNGTPLGDDIIEDCLRIHEEECVAVPWKRGDILLLDNSSVLHSRRSFGPPRRILASFGK